MSVVRMGHVISIKPDRIAEYKRLHAELWPEMEAALKAANIGNYSIYLREPENLLFGYREYAGSDFAADITALEATAISKRWLALTDPCQTPLSSAAPGEKWSRMVEVFHLD